MQIKPNSTLLSALLKALRPIASFLMKAGVGYREFSEIAKCAFVDVATTDYGLRGRPTNISRVAVMTGLTRKEVKRLRDKIAAGLDSQSLRVIPPAEILDKWFSDPEFLDSRGRPLELSFDGDEPSFTTLVRRYGGDIPAGAMRTELKRVGAIQESEDDRLMVVKRYFKPLDIENQLNRALGQAVFGLTSAIDHNISSAEGEEWVERVAYSATIKNGDASRIRRVAYDRAGEFVESINDLLSAYETIYNNKSTEDSHGLTIGVGVYYFEEMQKDQS